MIKKTIVKDDDMDIQLRKKLVSKLINYDGEPLHLVDQLRIYGWDCETDLVEIRKEHLDKVLNLYLKR